MKDLLSIVKDAISGDVLSSMTQIVGADRSATSSAINTFAPALIGALINKGDSVSGAQSLINSFKSNNYGADNVSNLLGVFGNKGKTSNFLDMGGNILGMLFGNRQSSILDKLIGMTSLGKGAGGSLLKLLAPIVVNKLAGLVFKNNMSAQGLVSYLTGQKSGIMSALPALGSVLGFSGNNTSSSSTSYESRSTSTGGSGGGGNMLKWLLPLLLLGGLLWFLSRGCNKKETVDTTTTTKVETPSTHTATHSGTTAKKADTHTSTHTATHTDATHSTGATVDFGKYTFSTNGDILDADGSVRYKAGDYSLDATGNLVDNNGRILVRASAIPTGWKTHLKSHLGQYAGTKLELDANGNLVDGMGKIIIKKGDFVEKDGYYYDKQGNKLGRIWGKIIKAIGDGAKKTAEGMKSLFSGMFKKAPGAKTTYTLSKIEFNPESHRITDFSKAEVEGLASALKAYTDSKINIDVYTNDGKNDKENKKLSKIRAEVVRDMLVTLGVDKGQVSFDGKGSSDAAKASADKVEIVVK